jgi:hypothetical protein
MSKFPFIRHRFRSSLGNTLLLVALCATGVLLVLAVALTLYAVFSAHAELRDAAEHDTDFAGRDLNTSDRVGEINNMVAASRQLVFNSRSAYKDTVENSVDLEPFALFLMNDARKGAQFVAAEQQRTLLATVTGIRDLAKRLNQDNAKKVQYLLPWAHADNWLITDVSVGYIDGLGSNVLAPKGNTELFSKDSPYIDPKTNLYHGDIVLPLDAPDNDLVFKLSTLPAPVQGTITPQRLLSNDLFRSTACLVQDGQPTKNLPEFIPSAVQFNEQLVLVNELLQRMQEKLSVSSTTATNGASPMP